MHEDGCFCRQFFLPPFPPFHLRISGRGGRKAGFKVRSKRTERGGGGGGPDHIRQNLPSAVLSIASTCFLRFHVCMQQIARCWIASFLFYSSFLLPSLFLLMKIFASSCREIQRTVMRSNCSLTRPPTGEKGFDRVSNQGNQVQQRSVGLSPRSRLPS